MRRVALGLLACWAVWQVGAAEENGWLTDLTKAQARAKNEKKMVLVDFNGSDWCPPCKALRKNVFSTPEFQQYASTNLVLVDIDFPKTKGQSEEQKAANEQLAKKHEIESLPTVIVFSNDGKELTKKLGYGGQSAKAYIEDLEKLRKQQTH